MIVLICTVQRWSVNIITSRNKRNDYVSSFLQDKHWACSEWHALIFFSFLRKAGFIIWKEKAKWLTVERLWLICDQNLLRWVQACRQRQVTGCRGPYWRRHWRSHRQLEVRTHCFLREPRLGKKIQVTSITDSIYYIHCLQNIFNLNFVDFKKTGQFTSFKMKATSEAYLSSPHHVGWKYYAWRPSLDWMD